MTNTLSIDRTSLALAALVVPSNGFELGGFAPGGMTWDKIYAGSRFVDDDVMTAARRVTTNIVGTLRATGTSSGTLEANEAILIAALSQFSYTVTWTETDTVDAVYTWVCDPADVAPSGDAFLSDQRDVWVQEFSVSIPRRSVPTVGSF